jgi:predicted nuclease of predicted toxin-antitoxin system
MLKFAVDENFNMHIVNGVLRRLPSVDIVRVQDVGLEGEDDPIILEWAASEGRIMLTHDVNTVTDFAYKRVTQGLPMPGVFEVSLKVPIGVVIEEILLLAECSIEGEREGQVNYLPLK